jgi:RiboL-PSP-HEPN
MLRWDNLGSEEMSLARNFLNQRNADESLLYRGMVISLAGAFEHFIRRILRDSVVAIGGSATSYESLDAGIKKENFYRTGLALGTIHEPLDYLDLNYESLAKNLGTCFPGSAQALLNAEAFAIFISIISPRNLEEALRRIGVTLRWDDFGKVEEVQKTLEIKGTRDTAKAVEANLKQFGKMRNKIAHSGSSGLVVTELEFERLLQFFRVFGRTLIGVVQTDLSKRRAK